MLLVAGIDALGRIFNRKIDTGVQTSRFGKNRQAVFLDRPGVDRRFLDDDVFFFQRAPDRSRGRYHGTQIGPPRVVDRRRNANDIEVGLLERSRISRKNQRGMTQIVGLDLARPVVAVPELSDPRGIDVESNHRNAGPGKRNGHE